ncbi:MAG: hypothetical protein EPO58_15705 [Chitinophagaceae bacterium]|nr:MAG: hypothetical protein EPO58_15705 [Chitinophagaceae bacterium]
MKKILIFSLLSSLFFIKPLCGKAQFENVKPGIRKMVENFYASFENPALLDKVLDKDFVDHMPFNPGAPTGREGFRQTQAFYHTIFSNFVIDFKGVYVDGNKVIVRSVVSAKHTGAFLGIQPTNKTVNWNAIDIYTVKNNMMMEGWHVESFLATYLALLKN